MINRFQRRDLFPSPSLTPFPPHSPPLTPPSHPRPTSRERLGGVGQTHDGGQGVLVEQRGHDGPIALVEGVEAMQEGGVQTQHQPPPRARAHAPDAAPLQLGLKRGEGDDQGWGLSALRAVCAVASVLVCL